MSWKLVSPAEGRSALLHPDPLPYPISFLSSIPIPQVYWVLFFWNSIIVLDSSVIKQWVFRALNKKGLRAEKSWEKKPDCLLVKNIKYFKSHPRKNLLRLFKIIYQTKATCEISINYIFRGVATGLLYKTAVFHWIIQPHDVYFESIEEHSRKLWRELYWTGTRLVHKLCVTFNILNTDMA